MGLESLKAEGIDEMRYAQIRRYDVANGKGIRTTLFVTGCTHKCRNCFNELYQDFEYGDEWTEAQTEEIIENLKAEVVSGLSILGGEPFQNAEGILELVKNVKNEVPNKDIWIWSGYTYEELRQDSAKMDLLRECDVLVDGRFIEELKDLTLKFRGSSNQRIIDVKKTLEKDEVVEYAE